MNLFVHAYEQIIFSFHSKKSSPCTQFYNSSFVYHSATNVFEFSISQLKVTFGIVSVILVVFISFLLWEKHSLFLHLKILHFLRLSHATLFAEAWNFVKKETLAQVFFCEVCEISKNAFFYRTSRWLLLPWKIRNTQRMITLF